jgi:hypothetical protein
MEHPAADLESVAMIHELHHQHQWSQCSDDGIINTAVKVQKLLPRSADSTSWGGTITQITLEGSSRRRR